MTKTIEQKAFKFIDENQLIKKGDRILVALSGGADSVSLLSFLTNFKKRFGIEVFAFHLNHKLRGRASNQDEKFCVDICSQQKIKLVNLSRDVKSYSKKMKVSLEEAGREIRYIELNKAAKKFKCNKIATAHNSSDNAETILLNFFKGTGIKGLTGIPIRRENIIRPVLCLTSEEIRAYLKLNKISFRLDESNLDNDYERNFLRNEIIPNLKAKINPRIEEKINSTAAIFSELNSYLLHQVNELRKDTVKIDAGKLRIKLKPISKIDKSLLTFFLKNVIENIFHIELSLENINSVSQLLSSQSGKSIQLKEDIVASRERSELIIREKSNKSKRKSAYKIKAGQTVEIDGKIILLNKVSRKLLKFTPDKSIEFISIDGMKDNFEIRKWATGDKFQPVGMKGRKKVSDFLADEKIPSSEKKEQLVLTNESKIVWVVGHRINEHFKVLPQSKNILKLTVTER